ncbi:MAG: DUF4153 domain-containing protein [Gemmatimonadales bacterium]
MTTSNVRAVRSVAAACVLGLLGDLLLRTGPWSLNLAIWMIVAVTIPAIIVRGGDTVSPNGPRYWLVALGCVVAALATVVRASSDVWAFNMVALFTGLAVLLYEGAGGMVARATPEAIVLACWRAALSTAFGAAGLLLGDVEWRGASSTSRRVLVGGIVAGPIVVVLGALLAAGDPAFAAVVGRVDLQTLISHLFLWGFFAWITAGYLRALVVRPQDPGAGLPTPPRFGVVEVRTVLVAVGLLFALFVGVQLRALFGGAAFVTAESGLTFAEYARQGFFQLVAVGALTLGLLVAIDWGNGLAVGVRALAWGILALLALILASAGYRMALYLSLYGLSTTRLYATMAIGWIAVAAVWFGFTVLRGRRDRFVIGALVAACLWLAVLDVGNPEAFVVDVNVGRAVAGESFDAEYLTKLSADAVPALVAALPKLSVIDRCAVVVGLKASRARQRAGGDWRTWNLARWRGEQLVAALDAGTDHPECLAKPAT